MIATTAGDPEAAVKSERLRPELYYGLTVLVIRSASPARAQARPAAPGPAAAGTGQSADRLTCGGFTPQAVQRSQAYDWPGNIGELARVIDAAHGHLRSQPQAEKGMPLIDVGRPARLDPRPPRRRVSAALRLATVKPLDELLTEIERRLIETALSQSRQNKSRAAELLGISRPRLYRRIKELNLPDDSDLENGAVSAGVSPPGAS